MLQPPPDEEEEEEEEEEGRKGKGGGEVLNLHHRKLATLTLATKSQFEFIQFKNNQIELH